MADNGMAPTERRLPPFAALRAFEALIRLGGVRKAALALGVHHSVISRQSAQLEIWLGAPLLLRAGKRFTLTADGERFYIRISGAIAEIAEATDQLLHDEAGRPVRIWCSEGLSTEWMARHLKEFEREHPDIPVELRPSELPANLLQHEADANIFMSIGGEAERSEAHVRHQILARPLAMLAVSPNLAAELSIETVADLLRVPLLHGAHTDDWRCWLTMNGVDPPAVLPGELCWNPHMALEAARLGRGISLGNRFFFERDLAAGNLVELAVPGTTSRSFGVYTFAARQDRWSNPRLIAVRHFLANRMKMMEV